MPFPIIRQSRLPNQVQRDNLTRHSVTMWRGRLAGTLANEPRRLIYYTRPCFATKYGGPASPFYSPITPSPVGVIIHLPLPA